MRRTHNIVKVSVKLKLSMIVFKTTHNINTPLYYNLCHH